MKFKKITALLCTENWKYYGEEPYTFSGFFAGENYDAGRAEVYEKYSYGDFDDSGWDMPEEVVPVPIDEFSSMPPGFGRCWPAVNRKPEILLLGGYNAPVHVTDELCAKTMTEPEPGVLDFARGSVNSPYGVVRAGWEKKGDETVYHFEIPANVSASLILPGMPVKEYGSGCYELVYGI